jgi:ketosteroid isomerase-like protein
MKRPIRLITILSLLFVFNPSVQLFAQKDDVNAIKHLLMRQKDDWNSGNVTAFMKGYWESDSLLFIGKSVSNGYQKTLDNYKKSYPDTAAMGHLDFEFVEFRKLSPEYYFVVGKWHLKRSIGDVGGAYTLLFRKIKGHWTIVVDHSS